MKRLVLAVLLGLTVARGASSPGGWVAHAAPGGQEGPEVAKARAHFKAGEKAFNAGDYAKALAEFEAGYALVPRPGFLLNLAHTERRLGHAARARDLYQRYLEAEPESKQRDEVLGLIADLERTLAASPSSSSAPPPSPEPPPSSEPEPATPVATASPLPTAPEPRDPPAPIVSAPPPSSASDASGFPDAAESPESPPAAPPLYRRWWFWAALGAVAVGTTTAIVLGTRSNGPTFHSDGSLGRVGDP